MSKKIHIRKKDNLIIINNNTNYTIEKCYLQAENISGDIILSKEFDIKDNENLEFEVGNEIIRINLYENKKLLISKVIGDLCIVTTTNKLENTITDYLITRLLEKTDIDIVKFTKEFDDSNENYESIKINSDDNISIICEKSCDLPYKRFIYINNKLLLNNVDFLKYISSSEYPVFNKIDSYDIGPITSSLLNFEDEVSNLNTNIIFFRKDDKNLFSEITKLGELIESNVINEEINDDIIFSSYFKKQNTKVNLSKICEYVKNKEDFDKILFSNPDIKSVINYNPSFIECESLIREYCIRKIDSQKFEDKLIDFYKDIKQTENRKNNVMRITTHCVRGAFLEINSDSSRRFQISFLDQDNKIIHSSELNGNMWTRLNRKYYHDYSIIVKENGQVIYQSRLNLKDKRVYIALESSSLGDSLAWFPYTEEFRKKHGCKLIVSTFNNDFFKEKYPHITFVKPGENVDNLAAMYSIGWYYDEDGQVDLSKNPIDFRNQPLQKTASDILGLEYKEIRPEISYKKKTKEKKVGIAIHGTAQTKYWNNPKGWQDVTDYLISIGYEVVIYSKEEDGYMGNKHPVGAKKFPSGPLPSLMEDLSSCEFFIGIGSGLSWLAWTLELPIVLISGFSYDFTETVSNTWRVINKNVCTGCFNTHRLVASDWNWCPVHKGTERQFECTKQISSEMVIEKINQLIKFTF